MATKYKTVTETVTAVQFTFDTVKEVYSFLEYRDINFSVKERTLSGVITGKDDVKIPVRKNNYIVKDSNGVITVWNPDEFKKRYVEEKSSTEK